MPENHCAKCGKPTGTKARLCREHGRENMRLHRQKRLGEARKAGSVLAAGVIEAAELFESRYLRVALLEGAQELIARKLKNMGRQGSRSS